MKSLSKSHRIFKRTFDIIISAILVFLFWWVILLGIFFCSISTKSLGLFTQVRIGQFGKPFTIYKLQTFNSKNQRPSSFGKFLRKSKIDELPQLFQVLFGTMSLVGPRPDIAGYADKLIGDDSIILSLKPGLTGPASIVYRNEDKLLKLQPNPENYNNNIIWPRKVAINKNYLKNYNYCTDIYVVWKTFIVTIFNL